MPSTNNSERPCSTEDQAKRKHAYDAAICDVSSAEFLHSPSRAADQAQPPVQQGTFSRSTCEKQAAKGTKAGDCNNQISFDEGISSTAGLAGTSASSTPRRPRIAPPDTHVSAAVRHKGQARQEPDNRKAKPHSADTDHVRSAYPSDSPSEH